MSRGDAVADLLGDAIVPVDCDAPDDPIRYRLVVDGSFGSVPNPGWGEARLAQARRATRLMRARAEHNDAIRLCLENTRSVIFFESDSKNSFYHPDLRRTVFINWRAEQSIHHFIEELIHQSVHSVIDEISKDGALFVTSATGEGFDPDHTHMINADSETFVRFHSMATLALICEGLLDLPEDADAAGRAVVLGRASFAFQKLSYDLQYFIGNMEALAPSGAAFLKAALALYQHGLAVHGEDFQRHDMTGQPYVFDEAAFLLRNGETHRSAV